MGHGSAAEGARRRHARSLDDGNGLPCHVATLQRPADLPLRYASILCCVNTLISWSGRAAKGRGTSARGSAPARRQRAGRSDCAAVCRLLGLPRARRGRGDGACHREDAVGVERLWHRLDVDEHDAAHLGRQARDDLIEGLVEVEQLVVVDVKKPACARSDSRRWSARRARMGRERCQACAQRGTGFGVSDVGAFKSLARASRCLSFVPPAQRHGRAALVSP